MLLKEVKDCKDNMTWRCHKVHHVKNEGKNYTVKDVKVSIRENSWILDAWLSLELIFELIYLWIHKMTNAEIEHELRISHQTIIEWTSFFREVCINDVLHCSQPIGVEAEIDESKFGKRKYHKGCRVEGQWVFRGCEKYNKSKIFMIPVSKRDCKTLIPIIQKWILPRSIIHSDCWKAYNQLQQLGYKHVTVNHSKEFYNESNAACTNAIESDWRHAKCAMPKYGIHKGMHAGYLAEFLWFQKYDGHDKFITLIEKKLLLSKRTFGTNFYMNIYIVCFSSLLIFYHFNNNHLMYFIW